MSEMPYRKKPCEKCPWVQTTPPGEFSAARYAALRTTTGYPGAEAPPGSPLFACHISKEGKDVPCAGWLAAVGYYSIQVRVLIAHGRLPRNVLQPGRTWPPLFTSYDAMEAVMAREDEDAV